MSNLPELEKFSKHIPHILRHQLLCQLAIQYTSKDTTITRPETASKTSRKSTKVQYGEALNIDKTGIESTERYESTPAEGTCNNSNLSTKLFPKVLQSYSNVQHTLQTIPSEQVLVPVPQLRDVIHLPSLNNNPESQKYSSNYSQKKRADDTTQQSVGDVVKKIVAAFISPSDHCMPSIQRFECVLLFVDISGFTALSQKLNVDDLKTHINDYFKKIIGLIEKYGGEVIKFAGDALFVIWQIEIQSDDAEATARATLFKLNAAILCGLDIANSCSDYRVDLTRSNNMYDSHLGSMLLTRIRQSSSAPSPQPEPNLGTRFSMDHGNFGPNNEESVAYLNIHAGLSLGTLAGIDVGAHNRWEYLLLGTPIADIAQAEEDAEKCELVISAAAHRIYHSQYNPENVNDNTEDAQGLLPCGCMKMKSGTFKVNNSNCPEPILNNGDNTDLEVKHLHAEILRDILTTLRALRPVIKQSLTERHIPYVNFDPYDNNNGIDHKTTPSQSPDKEKRRLHRHDDVNEDQVDKDNFFEWCQNCLVDDLAWHVHESDRSDYVPRNIERLNVVVKHNALRLARIGRDKLEQHESNKSSNVVVKDANLVSRMRSLSHTENELKNNSTYNSSTHSQTRNSVTDSVRFRNRNRHSLLLQNDSSFIAELRSVIVLFIKVDTGMQSMNLYMDNENQSERTQDSIVKDFHFLPRTDRERNEDSFILGCFQRCMEIMIDAFMENGGQLRQFIVDDKGTVCIGTFGLKGSVNYDNASAAIECAKSIIFNLQKSGMNASIGITSGKAYCGFVGSPKRHEYAVMGPSTNLSARLMSKAKPGEIICDIEIRKRDRTHYFVKLSEIHAKGYSEPVAIFKPVIKHFKALTEQKGNKLRTSGFFLSAYTKSYALSSQSSMSNSNKIVSVDSIGSSRKIISTDTTNHHRRSVVMKTYGRIAEVQKLVNFFLPDTNNCNINIDEYIDELRAVDDTDDLIEKLVESHHNFHIELSALFAAVVGHEGVGKTAFVASFCRELEMMSHSDNYNIAMFQNKANMIHQSESFYACSGIIQQMLVDIAITMLGKPVEAAANNAKAVNIIPKFHENADQSDDSNENDSAHRHHHRDDSHHGRVHAGLDHVMSLIPKELCAFRPLLNNSGLVHLSGRSPKEDDDSSSFALHHLSGPEKIGCIIRLLAAIVHQYVLITRKFVVIIIDDLQLIDLPSWEFLQHLWQNNSGLAILASMMVDPISVSNTITRHTIQQKKYSERINLKAVFGDSNRFLKVELGPLDFESIRKLASDIFNEIMPSQASSESNPLPDNYLIEVTSENDIKNMLESPDNNINKLYNSSDLDVVYHRIYENSGGNALYAYEISKAVAERYVANQSQIVYLSDILDSFQTSRIEEAISYRFDQFSSLCQLLLKIASVACSSGGYFTLVMLKHVLNDRKELQDAVFPSSLSNSYQHIHENDSNLPDSVLSLEISSAFAEILVSEEFLRVVGCGMTRDSLPLDKSPSPDIGNLIVQLSSSNMKQPLKHQKSKSKSSYRFSIDENSFHRFSFEFKISLEQKAIYNLLLDDQKQSIHEKIASYLELNLSQNNDHYYGNKDYIKINANMINNINNSVSNLNQPLSEEKAKASSMELMETGYHWEHAHVWSAAMICYYKSAEVLETIGSFGDCRLHLLSALQMMDELFLEAFPDLIYNNGVNNNNAATSNNNDNNTGDVKDRNDSAEVNNNNNNNNEKQNKSEDNNYISTKNSDGMTSNDSASRSNESGSFYNNSSSNNNAIADGIKTICMHLCTINSREDVHRLFNGDGSLLETGLKILTSLARNMLDESDASVSLIESAMLILSITYNTNLFSEMLPDEDDRYTSDSNIGSVNTGLYRASSIYPLYSHSKLKSIREMNEKSFIIPAMGQADSQQAFLKEVFAPASSSGDDTPIKQSPSKIQTKEEKNIFSISTEDEENNDHDFMNQQQQLMKQLQKKKSKKSIIRIKSLSVYVQLLAGIMVMYSTGRLPDDDQCTRQWNICEMFISIAQSDPTLEAHTLVGYSWQRSIFVERGMTLAVTIVPICCLYGLYGYEQEAVNIFQLYMSREAQALSQDSLFRKYNPLFSEWLQMRLRLSKLMKNMDVQDVQEEDEHNQKQLYKNSLIRGQAQMRFSLIKSILNRDFIFSSKLANRPWPLQSIIYATLGVGMEFMCADICFHTAVTPNLASSSTITISSSFGLKKQEEKKRLLETALEYIDSSLMMTSVLKIDSIFNNIHCLLLKVKILISLVKIEENINRSKSNDSNDGNNHIEHQLNHNSMKNNHRRLSLIEAATAVKQNLYHIKTFELCRGCLEECERISTLWKLSSIMEQIADLYNQLGFDHDKNH
eukprot:gene13098-17555_t